MAGARFDVRVGWAPVPAGATAGGRARGGSRGEADGASLEVGADEAAPCYEEAGAYRVRPSGLDVAEFLFAAGPAEPLRPLGVDPERLSLQLGLMLRFTEHFFIQWGKLDDAYRLRTGRGGGTWPSAGRARRRCRTT